MGERYIMKSIKRRRAEPVVCLCTFCLLSLVEGTISKIIFNNKKFLTSHGSQIGRFLLSTRKKGLEGVGGNILIRKGKNRVLVKTNFKQ